MNKFIIIVIIIIILFLSYLFIAQNKKTDNQVEKNPLATVTNRALNYTDISDAELSKMLTQKDFKLVDVHIPEQKHILGTDYVIPYNQVAEFIKTLPDKNEKIVLYCRSGGMSRALAKELANRGYKHIFNLVGGANGWVAGGGSVLPVGSIK